MSITKDELDAAIKANNEAILGSIKELIAATKPANEPPKTDPAKSATQEEEEKAKALVELQNKMREEAKLDMIHDEIIKGFKVDELDPIAKATYNGMKSRGDIPKVELANWIMRTNAQKTFNDCKDHLMVVKDGIMSKSALYTNIEAILGDEKSDLANLSNYINMAVELKNSNMRPEGGNNAPLGGAADNGVIMPRTLEQIKNGASSNAPINNVNNAPVGGQGE